MSEFTTTPKLGLYKPKYNQDAESWGDHLNANADTLDLTISGLSTDIGGPFLPLTGGQMAGPLTYYAAGGATALRSAQDRATDVANVLDFGADPTGVMNSAPAINAALATGHTVWLPRGTYRLLSALAVGLGQTLYGDGVSSILNIDADFDPVAPGVVIITPGPNPIVQFNLHSTLRDFQINFTVAADTITTATAAASVGATTITVASAANIRVGFYVANATNPAAIQRNYQNATGTLVQSIAGNVITLDTPVRAPGVASGDQINFAPTRAQYMPLGSASNLAGGTGTKYPWAVYNNGANGFTIDGLLIRGAWNGIYQRGDAFDFRNISVGALNVGLDADQCYNFPSLINYRFFNWGWEGHSAGIGPFYDGVTIAANLGECDGLSCLGLQIWQGVLNITPNWTWGQIVNLMLDSDRSLLNIQSGVGFLMITNCYTTKTSATLGVPITINSSGGTVRFDNLHSTNFTNNPTMLVQNGFVTVISGNSFNGIPAPGVPAFNVTGGRLFVSGGMRFAAASTINGVCFANSGTGVLQVQNVNFDTPAGGGVAFQITDNIANIVRNIVWNGWLINGVPAQPLGRYDTPLASNVGQMNVTAGQFVVGNAALSVSPSVAMVAAGGVTRRFQFFTATANASGQRWSFGANATAESSTATGSDFFLNAWDNSGNILFSPLTITRSTGLVSMIKGAVISGGASTIDGANIGLTTPGQVVGTVIRTNSPTGPTFTGGAGAPSSTQPVGSIYSNVTGTTGTRLYVSAGAGTWAAVAGV